MEEDEEAAVAEELDAGSAVEELEPLVRVRLDIKKKKGVKAAHLERAEWDELFDVDDASLVDELAATLELETVPVPPELLPQRVSR